MSEDAENEGGAESALIKIRADWKKAGEKTPNEKEKTELLKAYTEASGRVDDAEKKLDAAEIEQGKAVLALAKAYGARPLRIGGVLHEFACRKDKVFFRKKSSKEVVDL